MPQQIDPTVDPTSVDSIPGLAPQTPQLGGAQAPIASNDPNDFINQFTQRVLGEFNKTPESIKQEKIAEYYRNLGINPNTKKGKFLAALHEAGLGAQTGLANKTAKEPTPIIPFQERMQNAADTEYYKNLPNIRNEAQNVINYQKAQEANKSKETVQDIKNTGLIARAQIQKEIAAAKNDIARNIAGGRTRLLNAQAAAKEQATKELEGNELYKFLPNDVKISEYTRRLREIDPENYDANLKDLQQFSNARKPTQEGAAQNLPDNLFSDYLQRKKDLFSAQALAHPPQPKAPQTIKMDFMDKDGVKKTYLVDKGTGQMTPITSPTEGEQPYGQQTAQALSNYKTSEGLFKTSLSTITNILQNNRENEFLGPAAGNKLAQFLRTTGIDAAGQMSPEEISKLINTQHGGFVYLRSLLGARLPVQILDDFQSKFSSLSSPQTAVNTLATMIYTNQIAHGLKANLISNSDLTPEVTRQMTLAIENYKKQIEADRKLPPGVPKSNPTLPDINQIIQTAKVIDLPKKSSAKKASYESQIENIK